MAGKKTPVFDWSKMEFKRDLNGSVKTGTGNVAVEELFFKAQQTRRGVYLIYANQDDPDQHHKYGNDLLNVIRSNLTGGVKESEIKRAVKEAGIYLDGVKDVFNIEVIKNEFNGRKIDLDEVYIKAVITTIYDDKLPIEGIITLTERG